MTDPLRIYKKLSGKHIVWFGETNQWVGFETPAYNVFEMYERGWSADTIADKISSTYGLSSEESGSFVSEIIEGLRSLTNNAGAHPLKESIEDESTWEGFEAFSIRYYLINKMVFQINYGSKLMEYYLHPPLAYLELNTRRKADHTFSISEKKAHFLLRSEYEKTTWLLEDVPKLKRKLTLKVLDYIYRAKQADWFSRVHAAAVTNEKQAMILSSESGSGKSTLAILLQSRGLRVVSDDMLPLKDKNLAYPVPSGLSVKKGAFDVLKEYFPGFDPEEHQNYKYGSKDICFLPISSSSKNTYRPVPVTMIVFVKYKKDSGFSFRHLTSFEALKMYHQEAWVDKSYNKALEFIEWFESLSYYSLEYSNTEEALNAISELFAE